MVNRTDSLGDLRTRKQNAGAESMHSQTRKYQGLSCSLAAWQSRPGSSQFRSLESGGEVLVGKHCHQRGSRGKRLRRRPSMSSLERSANSVSQFSPGPVWVQK